MYEPYIYELSFAEIISDYFIPELESILIPAMVLWFVSWGIIKIIVMFKTLIN